jgi:biofilm protein TabA
MIVGKIGEIQAWLGSFPNLLLAVDHLQQLNIEIVEDSQYCLPQTNHSVIVKTFTPDLLTKFIKVEGHKRFIDLYYILDGTELIGWKPSQDVLVKFPYDQQRDVWTSMVEQSQLTLLKLSQGDIVVLFPEDAHAPQLTDDGPLLTRKVIIKIEI